MENSFKDPFFQGGMIINENLVLAFHKQATIQLSPLMLIGSTILDISKEFMYKMYYTEVQPNIDGQVEILYTDTDSWFLKVTQEKSKPHPLYQIRHIMDFSNYDKSHPWYNKKTENQLGLFKDEMKGVTITEFVAVRSKSYAFLSENSEKPFHHRAKGVPKHYSKNLRMEHYKECVNGANKVSVPFHSLKSRNHEIKLTEQTKFAFTSFDDKRLICKGCQHTYPHGSCLYGENCYFCNK